MAASPGVLQLLAAGAMSGAGAGNDTAKQMQAGIKAGQDWKKKRKKKNDPIEGDDTMDLGGMGGGGINPMALQALSQGGMPQGGPPQMPPMLPPQMGGSPMGGMNPMAGMPPPPGMPQPPQPQGPMPMPGQ